MSGSHRQHRDNPDFKSKMQIANMPNPKQSYKERVTKDFDKQFNEIMDLETDPTGTKNMLLIRDERGRLVEGIDFNSEKEKLRDFISKALDDQMKEVMIAWEEGDSFNSFKERLKRAGLIS